MKMTGDITSEPISSCFGYLSLQDPFIFSVEIRLNGIF